jgi:hypothetical protein
VSTLEKGERYSVYFNGASILDIPQNATTWSKNVVFVQQPHRKLRFYIKDIVFIETTRTPSE